MDCNAGAGKHVHCSPSKVLVLLTSWHIKSESYKQIRKEELEGVDDGGIGSPGGVPPYEVVDFWARVVVEGHGGREVFVIGKSGLFWLVLTASRHLHGRCI